MACGNLFNGKSGDTVDISVTGTGGCTFTGVLEIADCSGTEVDHVNLSQAELEAGHTWTLQADRIYTLFVSRFPGGCKIETSFRFNGGAPVVDSCEGGTDPITAGTIFVCTAQKRALRMLKRRAAKLGAVALLFVSLAAALNAAPPPQTDLPRPNPGEKLTNYRDRLLGAISGQEIVTAKTQQTASQVGKEVAHKTTSTAAPEGFADRVNETISDFLPLLQANVSAVSTSEDKKSVTVKLNPLKLSYAEFGFSGTATQPDVFAKVADDIVASARDSEEKALLSKVNDFGDLTYTLEANALPGGAGGWSRRMLFGRTTATYQPFIEALLKDELGMLSKDAVNKANAELGKFLAPLGSGPVGDLTFEDVKAKHVDPEPIIEALMDLARAEAALAKAAGVASPWRPKLASLIDNQPQLVLKVSRRESDEVVGPRSTAYTLNYEFGSRNVNAVLREFHRLEKENPAMADADRRQQAIANVTSDPRFGAEDRLVTSITYKDVGAYHFVHPYTFTTVDSSGADIQVARTANVNLARSREWRGKLVWTRLVRSSNAVLAAAKATGGAEGATDSSSKDQKPRLTASLEAVSVRDDPTRQNQVIGRLSYVVPLGGNGLTLPLTLTWANRPEFVGQNGTRLSAHVSVSFKSNAVDSGS